MCCKLESCCCSITSLCRISMALNLAFIAMCTILLHRVIDQKIIYWPLFVTCSHSILLVGKANSNPKLVRSWQVICLCHILFLGMVNISICLVTVPKFRDKILHTLFKGEVDHNFYSITISMMIFNTSAVLVLFYVVFYMLVDQKLLTKNPHDVTVLPTSTANSNLNSTRSEGSQSLKDILSSLSNTIVLDQGHFPTWRNEVLFEYGSISSPRGSTAEFL